MSFVQLRNNGDTEIVLPKHTRRWMGDEIEEEGCYMIEEDSHGLAARKVPCIKMGQRQPATKLSNGLTIYGSSDSPQFKQLAQACTAFPQVWVDQGKTVSIPESEYLQVPLIQDWDKFKVASRVYPLSQKDREVVDAEFDKFHAQGKMGWTSQPTPFGFPVFVVWGTLVTGGVVRRKSSSCC